MRTQRSYTFQLLFLVKSPTSSLLKGIKRNEGVADHFREKIGGEVKAAGTKPYNCSYFFLSALRGENYVRSKNAQKQWA